MFQKKESNYKIDGVDSWIHCIRFGEDDLNAGKPVQRKRAQVRYHYHEYIELLYFYDGKGEVWVNGTETEVCGGSLVIISSNMAHDVLLKEPTKYVCVKFSPSVLYENEPFFINFKYALPFMSDVQQYVFSKDEIENTTIHSQIEEIMCEWDRMEYGFELAIRSAILKVFLAVIRLWHSNGDDKGFLGLSSEMKTAIAYIGENYSTATEKQVAETCNFSYNYFSKIFKETVGKSFKDYLMDVKLSQAEKMLLTTKMSITEIAEKTGFSSISHFIARFREAKGITPNGYRKKLLKG